MSREDLQRRIDAIERSYEFLLAYAAQGLPTDVGAKSGGELRDFLERLSSAIRGLSELARAVAGDDAPVLAFLDVLAADEAASLAAVEMVRSRPGIGSAMVDDLNGSIHLRALLTDLFLLDEVLRLGDVDA